MSASEAVKAKRGLTIKRMVKLGCISRSSYYLSGCEPEAVKRSRTWIYASHPQDRARKARLQTPSDLTTELRRQRWRVNLQRLQRLMREDNLLACANGSLL